MKYTITNNKTGRTYVTESYVEVELDRVWMSQKDLFSFGCQVTITDENGNSKTFDK